MKSKRPHWNAYFLDIAVATAARSTCNRAFVGCVIVDDSRQIQSTGYNGSLPGHPHCDDVGHQMVHDHCIRTVHAEVNAVIQAGRAGRSVLGCTAYVTHSPCYNCMKVLISAGIKRIICMQARPDMDDVKDLAYKSGIEFAWIKGDFSQPELFDGID